MVVTMDVCIKNINDGDWKSFKSESIKHDLKVGEFFNILVHEHEEKCTESNWDTVLFGEKSLKGMIPRGEGKKLREMFHKGFYLREMR